MDHINETARDWLTRLAIWAAAIGPDLATPGAAETISSEAPDTEGRLGERLCWSAKLVCRLVGIATGT